MENSPIATLSAELRNQIYHLVLTHPEPIIIISSYSGDEISSPVARQRKLLALTRTCRTIRKEAIKIFYAVNTFKYVLGIPGLRTQELVQGFDKQIGRECAALIHKIVVMPLNILMTAPLFENSRLFGGEGVIFLTARELVDLASKDSSRTYQLECDFHCYIDARKDSPERVWEDSVLLDVPDLVEGCKKARAGIRQKIEETKDSAVRVCLEKMGKGIADWQEIFMHDYFKVDHL